MGNKLPSYYSLIIGLVERSVIMRKVLLLDIDYTVIKTDSMIDFIVFSIKKDFRNSIIYIKSFFLIIAYIFKLKTIEEVK